MLYKREMLMYMLTYAGEQVKARRQAVLDEIARVKEERAAQEEVEKEQLALLLWELFKDAGHRPKSHHLLVTHLRHL